MNGHAGTFESAIEPRIFGSSDQCSTTEPRDLPLQRTPRSALDIPPRTFEMGYTTHQMVSLRAMPLESMRTTSRSGGGRGKSSKFLSSTLLRACLSSGALARQQSSRLLVYLKAAQLQDGPQADRRGRTGDAASRFDAFFFLAAPSLALPLTRIIELIDKCIGSKILIIMKVVRSDASYSQTE